jgi:hypothetical protein
MGIVLVAFLAAWATGVPPVRITSTLRRTKLVRQGGKPFELTLAVAMLESYVLALNVTEHTELAPNYFGSLRGPEAGRFPSQPILATFGCGCASTGKFRAKSTAPMVKPQMFFFILSLSRLSLTNHLIRPSQHVGRDCQADLLRCFEIDDELKLLGLLHRKISGLSAFQDFIDVNCRSPV